MKRFILQGGYPDSAPDNGRSFWQAMVKNYQSPVTVLDCFFARLEEYWEIAMARDWAMTQALLPHLTVKLELAQPEKFIEQLQACDVLYIHGGNTEKLKEVFANIPDWQEHLEGKTIVGSSAGAELLSMSYLDVDRHETYARGTGLVPVKLLCHYKSEYGGLKEEWGRIYKDLEAHDKGVPILALREGEFAVFED